MTEDKPATITKDRLNSIEKITDVINSTLDIELILEMIMNTAMKLMGAERGFIMMLDPCLFKLEFRIARNIDRKKLESEELQISRTIVEQVFRSKNSILTHNAAQDPRYMDNPSVKAFGLRSVICVPLMIKGECQGVIYLDNRFKFGIFTENDLDFMKIFAHETAMAMENARLEEEKSLIKELFKSYVSPEIAEEIIQRGTEFDLRGEKRVVTIFFVDIRGFSSLSEIVPPHDLFQQLNNLFEEMARIIFIHNGTLLKFLGDGIMAAFGAPLSEKDDARRAVFACLEILEKLKYLNKTWAQTGLSELEIGIGMNTGEALVGNIGCNERREYSVIGDVANTAARLEKLNKEYNCKFIISEDTYKEVKDICNAEFLGNVSLRGKSKPVSIYKIILS